MCPRIRWAGIANIPKDEVRCFLSYSLCLCRLLIALLGAGPFLDAKDLLCVLDSWAVFVGSTSRTLMPELPWRRAYMGTQVVSSERLKLVDEMV